MNSIYIIGICGGTSSGKTTSSLILKGVLEKFGKKVEILQLDSFYKDLSKGEFNNISEFNFDRPSALDWDLIQKTINSIMDKKPTYIPYYDFEKCVSIPNKGFVIKDIDILIVEGIFALSHKFLISVYNISYYVTPNLCAVKESQVLLQRRIVRDCKDRGYSMSGVIDRWNKFIIPSFNKFINPSKLIATHIIITDNTINDTIKILADNIKYAIE